MNVALIGSVSSSWYALNALIRGGVEITAVLGVDESRAADLCDYRSIRSLAADAEIPFRSFIQISESGVTSFLTDRAPDLLWVIGLSQMVPAAIIQMAREGGVGFHPTMLPQGRGRAPVAWTILRSARAAVSLFYLTEEPDAGDLIAQREVPVLPDDYSEDLIERTNKVLADVVMELAPAIQIGQLTRQPQNDELATYYPKRTADDGLIDWNDSTEQIYRLIRAAGRPYHGAFTFVHGMKMIVWRGHPAMKAVRQGLVEPGTVVKVEDRQGVLVGTKDGALWITESKTQGGDPIARRLRTGDRLGPVKQV